MREYLMSSFNEIYRSRSQEVHRYSSYQQSSFLEYGFAIASSTYCLTFFFSEHTVAHNFFRLSPGFCFADGLSSLTLLRQGMKDGSGDGFLDWNVIGASICYLAAEDIVYYLLTLPHKLRVTIEECWRSMKKIFQRSSSSYTKPLLESSSKNNVLDLDEDVDVWEERNRVLSGSTDNTIIYLRNLRKVVMEKIVEFDLLKHAHKPPFALRGGNKRKLFIGIAMIGDPPIVILDEPSTVMVPIAKRFMWEVISHLSTRQGKSTVILATHCMNEAQALCTRIGIMVGGRLRCIGSPQHLKTRFGNHLELEIKRTEVILVDLENLCQLIQERLFDVPAHPRSLLSDLEVCIGGTDSITSENASAAEISLSEEMIVIIGHWLGNQERIRTLVSSTDHSAEAFGEQLSE